MLFSSFRSSRDLIQHKYIEIVRAVPIRTTVIDTRCDDVRVVLCSYNLQQLLYVCEIYMAYSGTRVQLLVKTCILKIDVLEYSKQHTSVCLKGKSALSQSKFIILFCYGAIDFPPLRGTDIRASTGTDWPTIQYILVHSTIESTEKCHDFASVVVKTGEDTV